MRKFATHTHLGLAPIADRRSDLGARPADGYRALASPGACKTEQQYQDYHRVLNRAKWSGLQASRILLGLLAMAFSLREFYLQSGRIWLRARPSSQVTQERVGRWLDNLLALAEADVD